MWLVTITQLLLLAGPAAGGRIDPAVPDTMPGGAIPTRQTLFSIPFQIAQADEPSHQPVEVHLYASTDRGKSWQLYDKVAPAAGRFVFRAGGDGEFWFLVRTVDRTGQLWPKGANSPELRVMVDTTPPTLQLKAWRGEAGQITTQWHVGELHLDTDSLKLQFRNTPDQPWQPVAIDRQNLAAAGPMRSGEVTWYPQSGAGAVEIRAEVSDVAGNPAVTHARVARGNNSATDPHGKAAPSPDVGSEVAGAAGGNPSGWRASATEVPGTRTTPYQFASTPSAAGPSTAHVPTTEDNTYSTRRQPDGSLAVQANPAIRDRYVPSAGQGAGQLDGLPPGERPRMVNSRLFDLDYEVGSVGPSGISRVELWGTSDGGKTWTSHGLDEDMRSPVLATVDKDGLYGFRVVVQSGVGLGGQPPRSGDLPDVWIGVDRAKPTARITSAERGTGKEMGRLIISWEADDVMLAARPVSLLFSDALGGPWSTIATGLENTGRYCWSADRRVPERIYLRLEVRDEAGNVGKFETTTATYVDLVRPTGTIRDVHPITRSSQKLVPRRYYWR